jgi:hypothetical protein
MKVCYLGSSNRAGSSDPEIKLQILPRSKGLKPLALEFGFKELVSKVTERNLIAHYSL